MFKLENVSLIYDLEKDTPTPVLSHINLEMKENKFYALLGPSGSGKTSLLYIMSGIKNPTYGKVFYNKIALNELEDEERSRIRLKEFGFVFQKHFLIPYMNILENILVPLNSKRKEDIDKAKELLQKLGMEESLYKRPYELSGGQCQRVAIARALINDPKVIFADEITASLDYKNGLRVIELLANLKNQATVVFVTHDERMLKKADEVIRLYDGRLEEEQNEAF